MKTVWVVSSKDPYDRDRGSPLAVYSSKEAADAAIAESRKKESWLTRVAEPVSLDPDALP